MIRTQSACFRFAIAAAPAIFCGGLSPALAQIKVACVGDSITAGYGLSNPGTQSYPAQLQTSTNFTQWNNVFITNSPALPFTWTDATTNSPQRFYRIKPGPPLP